MRTEAQEQEAVIRWAEMSTGRYPELALLFHIPNGGSRKDAREGAHFKKLGVKAGVPDLFLPIARHGLNGLFIEMKRERNYSVTEEQYAWIARLRKEGYAATVCCGYEEARKTIEEYLG